MLGSRDGRRSRRAARSRSSEPRAARRGVRSGASNAMWSAWFNRPPVVIRCRSTEGPRAARTARKRPHRKPRHEREVEALKAGAVTGTPRSVRSIRDEELAIEYLHGIQEREQLPPQVAPEPKREPVKWPTDPGHGRGKHGLLAKIFPTDVSHVHCCWCKKMIGREQASVEHLRPRARGGTDARWNLAIACLRCNWMRGDYDGTPAEAVEARRAGRVEKNRLRSERVPTTPIVTP